nr:MAG TPA: hypothetical protein [Caudoviricetes sp.]
MGYVLIKQEIYLNMYPFLKCIIYKNILKNKSIWQK